MHAPNSSIETSSTALSDVSPAIILTSQSDPGQHQALIKLLDFFGVSWKLETATDLRQRLRRDASEPVRILSRADGIAELLSAGWSGEVEGSFPIERIHSVFVYGLSNSSSHELEALGLEVEAAMGPAQIAVARNHKLSGIMAGLRFPTRGRGRAGSVATFKPGKEQGGKRASILSTDNGSFFSEVTYLGIPFFITTVDELVNLDEELPSGVFDIREYAPMALPVVLYLKWAFAESCWNAPAANACFVLDDPPLRPRYGFFDYDRLLHLMRERNFATTIAFIPWNWRRSNRETVALVKQNPDYYSLAVHGCNHTRDEFSGSDVAYLFEKSQRSLSLMNRHERETAISHDRVMVFPHGVFSDAAMAAIKQTDFFATASNEVISKDETPVAVTVADVWDVAVMCYSECALFTRRSLSDGIENIAFDLFLGKPAVIVLHHDDCDADCQTVVELVEQMNGLPVALRWAGLGDVLRRSYRQRQCAPGVREVEMYGTELLLANPSHAEMRFDITRLESGPDLISTLTADAQPLEWSVRGNHISFSTWLPAGKKTLVRLRYHPLKTELPAEEAMSVRTRTFLRRHVCEVRDNYLTRYRRSRLQTTSSRVTLINGRELSHGSVSGQVRSALQNFTVWLKRYGETSWDHQSFFAGPLGGRAKALYYRRPKLGTVAVAPMIFFEALVPAGRRLYHHPIRFPIADAHYAMGFAFLFEATGETSHLERATHFLRALQRSRSPGFDEYCWGYPFDWVWRGGVIARDTPLITTTPYCYEAFLQVWQYDQHEEWREVLASIIRHACHDIKDVETSARGSQCSYTANKGDRGGVINAAAYRAFLLASAAEVFDHQAYWQIGERNLRFVLENQSDDGSWPYAADGMRDFVDHFHTCFVMKSLAKIHRLNGHPGVAAALQKAVEYYFANLLDDEGMPKPFAKAPRLVVYKRELYDCAECINLCLLLRDRFPQFGDLLNRVVPHILNHWVKKDGSFRSRRLHFGWDNVPMHRWGQSQMFRALAYYLMEEKMGRQSIPRVQERTGASFAAAI